jgi:TonB family protein
MKELPAYLLQSSVSLAVLYIVYWLFLRRETFFPLNRIYIISSTFLALLIPFFRFDLNAFESARSAVVLLDPILIRPDQIGNMDERYFNLYDIAVIIYLAGAIILLGRLIFQAAQIYILVKRHGISRETGLNIIHIDKEFSSFSFFNLIFLADHYDNKRELKAVLDHEVVHIRQMHSLDILFIEFLKVILWFNPFAWFMGRSMKTIHEFLADEGVLQGGYDRNDYQHLLLSQVSGFRVSGLYNNFNFSLIKKRIIMTTKSRSAAIAKSKILFAIPAITAVILYFSAGSLNNVVAQDNTKNAPKDQQNVKPAESASQEVYTKVDKQPVYSGGDEARIKFLVDNIKYPEDARKKGIQGKVFVSFIVRADGSVTDVTAMKGIGSGCDEEAVRVVKMMPKWTPGEIKGKPVAVKYVLPIQFALDKNEQKKEEQKK